MPPTAQAGLTAFEHATEKGHADCARLLASAGGGGGGAAQSAHSAQSKSKPSVNSAGSGSSAGSASGKQGGGAAATAVPPPAKTTAAQSQASALGSEVSIGAHVCACVFVWSESQFLIVFCVETLFSVFCVHLSAIVFAQLVRPSAMHYQTLVLSGKSLRKVSGMEWLYTDYFSCTKSPLTFCVKFLSFFSTFLLSSCMHTRLLLRAVSRCRSQRRLECHARGDRSRRQCRFSRALSRIFSTHLPTHPSFRPSPSIAQAPYI